MHWRRWAAPRGHIPTPTNCGPCPHLALQIMGREQIEIRKCARWRWKTAPDWFGKSYPPPTTTFTTLKSTSVVSRKASVSNFPRLLRFVIPSARYRRFPRDWSPERCRVRLECCESFIRPELVECWGKSGWVSNSRSIHLLRLRYLTYEPRHFLLRNFWVWTKVASQYCSRPI